MGLAAGKGGDSRTAAAGSLEPSPPTDKDRSTRRKGPNAIPLQHGLDGRPCPCARRCTRGP